jgi:hypothetical protein
MADPPGGMAWACASVPTCTSKNIAFDVVLKAVTTREELE